MRIDRLPVTVGIAGASCSGKSTLARLLIAQLGSGQVAYLPQDAYYKDQSHLPPAARDQVNFDHPDVLDLNLLAAHIRLIKNVSPVGMPTYDFTTHTRSCQISTIEPAPFILVEGILIFADSALRELLDYKIYVECPETLRLYRRLKRDIAERDRTWSSVLKQYFRTVRPMYNQFVAPTKRYADRIVWGVWDQAQRAGSQITTELMAEEKDLVIPTAVLTPKTAMAVAGKYQIPLPYITTEVTDGIPGTVPQSGRA
jgi:uridine kinase